MPFSTSRIQQKPKKIYLMFLLGKKKGKKRGEIFCKTLQNRLQGKLLKTRLNLIIFLKVPKGAERGEGKAGGREKNRHLMKLQKSE